MSYSPLDVYRHFGEMYCLHLHVLSANQARNQQKQILSLVTLSTFPWFFLPGLFFYSEDVGDLFFRNVWLSLNYTLLKRIQASAVRTSGPTEHQILPQTFFVKSVLQFWIILKYLHSNKWRTDSFFWMFVLISHALWTGFPPSPALVTDFAARSMHFFIFFISA